MDAAVADDANGVDGADVVDGIQVDVAVAVAVVAGVVPSVVELVAVAEVTVSGASVFMVPMVHLSFLDKMFGLFNVAAFLLYSA